MTSSAFWSLALLVFLPGVVVGQEAAAGPADRTVAITIDDLPYVGGPQELAAARTVADDMLAALHDTGAPARGFVTGSRVAVEGEVDERIALLGRWRRAGVRLENHSWSHSSFETTPFTAYTDDVARGSVFPDLVMRAASDSVTFYRHPFNHTGPDETSKRQFEAWLSARGLRLTPFTIEHADYVFNALYVDAGARRDAVLAARIEQAYLDQLDAAFTFAEELSRETFGREIPQIFLIHANILNGKVLGSMLVRLSERGYRFVTLEDALSDPVYLTGDVYVGHYGISWLHRWRHGLGLSNRLVDEPEPPEWIMDGYRALSAR